MPLDVSPYLAVVAGRGADGRPDPADLHAFLIPGTVGVAYAPGVWHAGAIVLDRPGHFAVHWPRADRPEDTEIAVLAKPPTIAKPVDLTEG